MAGVEFTTIDTGMKLELEKFIDDVIWDIGRREFCEDTQKITTDLDDVESKQSEINGMFREIDDLVNEYRQNLDKQKKELELEFKKKEEEDSIYTYSYGNSNNKSNLDNKEKEPKEREEDSIYTYHYGDSNKARSKSKVSPPVAMEAQQTPIEDLIDYSATDEAIPMETEMVTPPELEPDQTTYKKPTLAEGMKLLGKKRGDGIWYEGTFLGAIKESSGQEKYKIKYDGNKGKSLLSGKSIAYATNPKAWEVKVGSRIVGIYLNEADSHDECFYAGIVAETPMRSNNWRYLIFFDDGFAQYMKINKIYCVYQQSDNVWEDIHPDSREFIKQYLEIYPDRPMVKVKANQWIRTEWNGQWWKAKVLEVDGSLVNMLFEVDKRTEWIYRGSPRLETLYTELQHAEAARTSEKGTSQIRSRSTTCKSKGPYVEYTRAFEEPPPVPPVRQRKAATPSPVPTPPPPLPARPAATPSPHSDASSKDVKTTVKKTTGAPTAGKQVAKKSTAQWRPQYYTQSTTQTSSTSTWEAPWLKRGQRNIGRPRGNLQQQKTDIASVLQSRLLQNRQDHSDDSNDSFDFNIARTLEQMRKERWRRFVPHSCTQVCVRNCCRDPSILIGENPYLKPELCGWRRELGKQRGSGRRIVSYRTPCCRSVRSLPEIDRYLLETKINYLTIDCFTFDPFVHTHTYIRNPKPMMMIKDISEGKEPIPVSCVNEIDDRCPLFVEYTTQRICARGVTVNTDSEFLAGCDCTDGCRDKSKCACHQLTIQATGSSNKLGIVDPEAGYEYRLLYDQMLTGIYECNENCSCDHTCHNRVAQHGLAHRLQVFKTEKRGWGLRCLDDIPVGSFVCTYAGELLTEELANEDGKRFGDEYLAELDLIEVAENRKEGYESDVRDPDNQSDSTSGMSDTVDSSEDESSRRPFSSCSSESGSVSVIASSSQTNRSTESDSEDDKGSRGKHSSSRKKVGPLLLRRQSSERQKGKSTEEWTIEKPQKKSKGEISEKINKNQTDDSASASVKFSQRLITPEDDSVYVFPSATPRVSEKDVASTGDTGVKKADVSAMLVDSVEGGGAEKSKESGEVREKVVAEVTKMELLTRQQLSGKDGESAGTDAGPVFVHEKWEKKPDEENAKDADEGTGGKGEPGESKLDGIKIKQEPDDRTGSGSANQKKKDKVTPGKRTDGDAVIDLTLEDEDEGVISNKTVREVPSTSLAPKHGKATVTPSPVTINYGYNTNVTKSVVDKETLEYLKARRSRRRSMKQSRNDNESEQSETDQSKTTEEKSIQEKSKKPEKPFLSPEIDVITVPDSKELPCNLQITGTTSLAVDSDVQTSDSESEASNRGMKIVDLTKTPEKDVGEEKREFFRATSKLTGKRKAVTPLRIRIPKGTGSACEVAQGEDSPEKVPSTRLFFNEEHCYVMDAKSIGNLGRYLNHSCSPNLFVQNVFVDTHDLRFPWVSFFAQQFIRAGSELTWDYNYEVGSVPNKILHCYCGSTDCRGRLL